MKRSIVSLFWLALTLALAPTLRAAADCTLPFGASGGAPFVTTGTLQFSNKGKQCYDWRISYNSQGFSALSIEVDSAPDSNGLPGSWSQFTVPEISNPVQGINPNTNATGASSYFRGSPAWIRVNLTSITGTGSVSGVLYGCQEPGCGSGMQASIAAGGTVTDVSSGNFSPLFDVTVATQTSTPVFSFAAIAEAPNLVYAGPISGANANPTFRSIVQADLPKLDPAITDAEISGCPSGCTNPALTQAQILAMNTVPVTVIAAQGLGTIIILDSVFYELVAGATAYANGGTFGLGYSSSVTFATCPQTVLTAAVNEWCNPALGSATAHASSLVVNLPLSIQDTGAAFTCALICGTLSYWIRYHIVSGA